MSDTSAPAAENGNQQTPRFHILAQYIKDFSFENPNAPKTFHARETPPQIAINVNVHGEPMGDDTFSCELIIEAKAGGGDDLLFNVELNYAGIIKAENFPEDQVNALVLIEGPRFLFPFAREIIDTATRQGGYPPLRLDPIDFVALYQRRITEQKKTENVN